MCSQEMCAHLEGMLDRDLRTAISPEKVERMQERPGNSECYRRQSFLVDRTKSCECFLRNLCHHLRKNLRKFKQAVTVLLCLSYVFNLPTSSSLPVTRSDMSSNGNHDQLKAIRDQAGTNTHRAKQYFNETFEQSPSHPAVTIYDKQRFDFFFEHTLTHFNFPSKSTIDESVLRDKGLNEFTRIFYDCFLRYNATFDMIPDANMGLRHDLKLLLLEINDYIVSENIEPLKEKYQDADVKLGLATSDDSTTAGRWQRNLVIYRDFVTTLDYFYHGYTYFVPDKNSSL